MSTYSLTTARRYYQRIKAHVEDYGREPCAKVCAELKADILNMAYSAHVRDGWRRPRHSVPDYAKALEFQMLLHVGGP